MMKLILILGLLIATAHCGTEHRRTARAKTTRSDMSHQIGDVDSDSARQRDLKTLFKSGEEKSLIVVISIVDRFDGCLMDVIRPFFFYTKIFLHSFITFLDMVCNFMKIDTISGSFYAVVTLQLPIKEQGFIL